MTIHREAIPTVLIGAMGVKINEINPMTVVTADKKTHDLVDFIEAASFRFCCLLLSVPVGDVQTIRNPKRAKLDPR